MTEPVKIPQWFFSPTEVEVESFHSEGAIKSRDSLYVKRGAYLYVNGKIVAIIIGNVYVSVVQERA